MSTSHTCTLSPHPLPTILSAFEYESYTENYDWDDYNDYEFARQQPRGPMVLISIGISSSISAQQSLEQSVDKAGVPTSSVYCKYRSDDDFTNLAWESPANVLVIHKDIEIAQDKEVSADTEEDTFSDWLRSHSESGPMEAAVDLVLFFGSDSAPSSLGCSNYDVVPQQPCGPMPSDGICVPTSPCQFSPPPLLVTPDTSVHEITSIISYSRSPLSAASIFSQSADNFSSPAIQSVHKVKSKDDVAIPTLESLARVFDVRDDDVTNVVEVFADDIGEYVLSAWPSSYFKFYAEEYSKESYSAVQSDPVYAKSDSDNECRHWGQRAIYPVGTL